MKCSQAVLFALWIFVKSNTALKDDPYFSSSMPIAIFYNSNFIPPCQEGRIEKLEREILTARNHSLSHLSLLSAFSEHIGPTANTFPEWILPNTLL